MTPLPEEVVAGAYLYPHHGPGGGYGQLGRFLPGRALFSRDMPFARAPEGSLGWQIMKKLFDARILWAARRARILHFLYAENHLRLTYALARRVCPRARTLATVHLPLDYYSREKSKAALRRLDGLIALTRAFLKELRTELPEVRSWFVPHGIDYRPARRDPEALARQSRVTVAVIGHNYRDWDTLEAIVDRARTQHPGWHFELVGVVGFNGEALRDRPNCTVHPRLDEAAYFRLMNASHVLLLPLTFATANNTLLEAYAAGLPAVCTDVPGLDDYAVSTLQRFRDEEQALHLLEEAASRSVEGHRSIRDRTHEEGKRFSWERIAAEVTSVYEELLQDEG
jgi:glycosyltransferase involved in cell wall biosynthesis